MFFNANHKEAADRLDDARRNGDTLGMMIALAQFDACAKVKKEKIPTVKNVDQNGIIEKNIE